ncbi:rhomboid family intramembrane serine protease, partial [Acinetobacter baumannii]
VALVVVCVAVHAVRQVVSAEDNFYLTMLLAFIPARMGPTVYDLPGGILARYTAFITHLFVHGDWMHLTVNSAWLLAMGTPVARRTSI